MSHLDVSIVNILLSITRVSLVQNKCVFCQLRVHYIDDPGITKTYLGIQHVKNTLADVKTPLLGADFHQAN